MQATCVGDVHVIKPEDLQRVIPDAKAEDHFVIVHAVDVCEQDKTQEPFPHLVLKE